MGTMDHQKEIIPTTALPLEESEKSLWRWLPRSQSRGIQARLIALIVLTLLPLLLLLAWIFYQRYEVRRTMALQTELEVARGIAATFSTYVEGVHEQNFGIGHAILSTMSGDREKVNRLLTSVANQSPTIRNLSWAHPDGTVIASSMPEMVGRDLSVRPYFKDVVGGKTWAIGDLTSQGIATNAPTLGLASGIRDEAGSLRGLLVAGIEPNQLDEIILSQKRPAGGVYAIFDRKGAVVFRRSASVLSWEQRIRWIESDALLRETLQTGHEQTGMGTLDIPGGEWVSARVPVREIGYVVGAGSPVEVAFEPVVGSLLREGLLALSIWCMALLFALLIARTISRPLHLLEQDARAMGTGKYESRDDPQAPEEVRKLRKTVESMAAALIQRADALHASEATLRESEGRFRVLFHNRHSPMLLIDSATGQIVEANPAACEYYGWSQETLQSMKVSEINQLGPDGTQQEMRKALGSETSKLFQFRHRLANGEIRDVEVSSGPIRISGQEYLFSIIHDITERKRAEREMRERNEGLALLSEAAHDLLSGSEPTEMLEHIYTHLSELLSLDGYFHYTVTEDGKRLHLTRCKGLPEKHYKLLERIEIGESICGRVARLREPIILEDVQNNHNSEARLIRSIGITAYACHPLIVKNQLVGTLSFGSRRRSSFDPQSVHLMVTIANLIAVAIHRREAEDTLQVYANKLEESNQELQSFAFIASHDLQEPLRKVESFSSLLLKDSGKLEEHQRDYLDRMRQAAGRMRSMVMALLELSRISTQGNPFEPVDLNETAREVLSDLEVQMLQTGGSVLVEPLPEIYGDPIQMHQLLQNLIGNALKYHKDGTAPQVTVTAHSIPGSKAEIRIADNGIGFDPTQIDRIFQPFQRLVGRSEYAGTGIGLAICRKIIERHQGTITAESLPGQGAVFIVQLPVVQTNRE